MCSHCSKLPIVHNSSMRIFWVVCFFLKELSFSSPVAFKMDFSCFAFIILELDCGVFYYYFLGRGGVGDTQMVFNCGRDAFLYQVGKGPTR